MDSRSIGVAPTPIALTPKNAVIREPKTASAKRRMKKLEKRKGKESTTDEPVEEEEEEEDVIMMDVETVLLRPLFFTTAPN